MLIVTYKITTKYDLNVRKMHVNIESNTVKKTNGFCC